MDPTQLASYILGGVGLALAASSVVPMFAMRVNAAMANNQLVKLANANNLDRFVKLCNAAPGTYLEAAKASALAATQAHSDDKVRVEAAVQEAFEASSKPLAKRWRGLAERGLFGVIVSGGGVGLWLSAYPLSTAIGVIGGATVLLGLYMIARRGHLDGVLASCRAEVLPAVVRAAVASAKPPPKPTPRPPSKPDPIDAAFGVLAEPAKQIGDAAAAPATLRDGSCPVCNHTTIRTLTRGDDRFTTYVCERCGYTQEFADLARLS